MIFLIAGVLYFAWQNLWKGNLLLSVIISTVYTLCRLTITLLGVSTTKISFGCHQQKSYFKMAQSVKGNLLAHMTAKSQGQSLLAAGNILFEDLAFGQQDLLLSLLPLFWLHSQTGSLMVVAERLQQFQHCTVSDLHSVENDVSLLSKLSGSQDAY